MTCCCPPNASYVVYGLEASLFQLLEKEFFVLQNWCEQKYGQLSNEEGVHAVENIILEDQRRRDCVGRYSIQGHEVLLKKRYEELSDPIAEELFNVCRSELDAISTVLKEVQTSHFGYDEGFSGMTSCLPDFDVVEEEDRRFRDFSHPNDSVVQILVSKLEEQITMELSKIDARIMRSVAVMQQLELKLGPASIHDCRTILLPLLKSFLRSHKKNTNKGGDKKLPHEKLKDKKKIKDSRRSKDLKDLSWNDQYVVRQDSVDEETSEQSQTLVDCDDFDCKL